MAAAMEATTMVMVGIALICMVGLRPFFDPTAHLAAASRRNCPDLYGGIATFFFLFFPPRELLAVFVGIALICMVGLRLEVVVLRVLPDVLEVGIALIYTPGPRAA